MVNVLDGSFAMALRQSWDCTTNPGAGRWRRATPTEVWLRIYGMRDEWEHAPLPEAGVLGTEHRAMSEDEAMRAIRGLAPSWGTGRVFWDSCYLGPSGIDGPLPESYPELVEARAEVGDATVPFAWLAVDADGRTYDDWCFVPDESVVMDVCVRDPALDGMSAMMALGYGRP